METVLSADCTSKKHVPSLTLHILNQLIWSLILLNQALKFLWKRIKGNLRVWENRVSFKLGVFAVLTTDHSYFAITNFVVRIWRFVYEKLKNNGGRKIAKDSTWEAGSVSALHRSRKSDTCWWQTGISRCLHRLECFQLFHYNKFMALSDVSVLEVSPPKNQLEKKKRKRLAGQT